MTPENIITAKGLCKSYETSGKRVEVLKDIDLVLAKGDTAAIVGASGAGKSTLLNILGTLDRPSSGTVYYGANDVFGNDTGRLAKIRNGSVGFVFQFHHLLPEFTAIENVMLPALIGGAAFAEARERAGALLSDVGLGSRLDHKPGELSGGEQQRTAIVRALVMDPGIVLADEPTGNLDAKTGEEVFELLLDFNQRKGTTMIIVTHNERLAGRLGRVLRMSDGRIHES